jgi:hypothetical protein
VTAVVCCVLCGMTAVDLPEDHACRPNLAQRDLDRLAAEVPQGLSDFYSLYCTARSRSRAQSVSAPSGSPEARLGGLCRTVAAATEGTRNSTLFWAASRLAEMAGELRMNAALQALVHAAAESGLDGREIARTIDSALKTRGVVA